MKVGVIGLGLIGGSIFKSLEKLGIDVIGVSESQNGLLKNITNNWDNLVSCDVVFVAVAMNKVLDTLEKLEIILPSQTVVADVSSLKEFVCKRNYNFKFIPTHPMAGTEYSGFENSDEYLFNGAKWVVCKQDCPEVLKDLIKKMGAEIIYANPKDHDEAAALVSHMPMVLAQALFDSARYDELALKLASSGFRDMTRLALSNEEMAADMVNYNHKNIQNAILKLYSAIGNLIGNNYPQKIKAIKQKRSEMYDENGKNIL